MASRRPVLLDATGAVVFAPSETADQTTPYTSPLIKLACQTGKRIIQFTLDGSDNLTVKEVDLAGNPVGLGTIVNGTNVPVGTQLVFRVGTSNLRAKWDPQAASGLGNTPANAGTEDAFVFVNGNTGVNQPNRSFAGTSLEVGEGIGVQTAE